MPDLIGNAPACGPNPLLAPWLKPSWLAKISIQPGPDHLEGDCWLWLGARTPDGYPVARGPGGRAGKQMALHRESLSQKLGEPLGAYQSDHACPSRNCIQPAHLVKATAEENLSRSSFWERGQRTQYSSLTPADWLSLADTSWCRIVSGYA
jgi:hypothetical protein